jgi:3-oxoacyl-[acyl-carrier protein] reductase
MAKTLSRELIRHNITINNICPGAFKTDRAVELMAKTAQAQGITIDEVEQRAIKTMPLGRYQRPEELGDLVAFLCSELACGITGTTIQIDGGIARGLL